MYRLLVVDDEANIRNVVREYAEFDANIVSPIARFGTLMIR